MANIDVSRLFFARETVGFSCRNCLFPVRNVLVFRAECSLFLERICIYLLQNELQNAHLGGLFSFIQLHKVPQRATFKPDCRPHHLVCRNKWQNDRLFETR